MPPRDIYTPALIPSMLADEVLRTGDLRMLIGAANIKPVPDDIIIIRRMYPLYPHPNLWAYGNQATRITW